MEYYTVVVMVDNGKRKSRTAIYTDPHETSSKQNYTGYVVLGVSYDV